MKTSLDVICIIDEEGRITQISSACEKLLGYTTEHLIGKKYIDFVHPGDVEETNKVAASIMSGTRYNDFENRYLNKDGNYVSVTCLKITFKSFRFFIHRKTTKAA